jgi:hypothetical protein
MIKEIDGYKFKVIFKAPKLSNTLYCEICDQEYSWDLLDQDEEFFKKFHKIQHDKNDNLATKLFIDNICSNCGEKLS